jgi:hypothetical protein
MADLERDGGVALLMLRRGLVLTRSKPAARVWD